MSFSALRSLTIVCTAVAMFGVTQRAHGQG